VTAPAGLMNPCAIAIVCGRLAVAGPTFRSQNGTKPNLLTALLSESSNWVLSRSRANDVLRRSALEYAEIQRFRALLSGNPAKSAENCQRATPELTKHSPSQVKSSTTDSHPRCQ
jgi:hypothetical protein